MSILCLFQIDPDTREATGTVVPFCSEKCRHEAKSSLDFPDHTEGISDPADFGFDPHCGQCDVEMPLSGSIRVEHNQPSVEAAQAALKAHGTALGIEGDTSMQVYHLLLSLREFCAASGVDFDKELAEVNELLASGELTMPAYDALTKKKLQRGTSVRHA
jgi:hypothetical protein